MAGRTVCDKTKCKKFFELPIANHDTSHLKFNRDHPYYYTDHRPLEKLNRGKIDAIRQSFRITHSTEGGKTEFDFTILGCFAKHLRISFSLPH